MVISLVGLRRHWTLWIALFISAAYLPWGFHRLIPQSTPAHRPGIITRFSARGRWVALTFADGSASPVNSTVVHDVAQAGDRATFFVAGLNALPRARWIHLARRLGDDIENHSEAHINLALHPYAQDVRDLQRANQAIQEVAGARPHWLYPPYGAASPAVLKAARTAHLSLVLPRPSDVISLDGKSANNLVESVLTRVQPGAIIVLDDNRRDSALSRALPKILSLLAVRGYHVGSVAQLWRRAR